MATVMVGAVSLQGFGFTEAGTSVTDLDGPYASHVAHLSSSAFMQSCVTAVVQQVHACITGNTGLSALPFHAFCSSILRVSVLLQLSTVLSMDRSGFVEQLNNDRMPVLRRIYNICLRVQPVGPQTIREMLHAHVKTVGQVCLHSGDVWIGLCVKPGCYLSKSKPYMTVLWCSMRVRSDWYGYAVYTNGNFTVLYACRSWFRMGRLQRMPLFSHKGCWIYGVNMRQLLLRPSTGTDCSFRLLTMHLR